MPTAASTSKYTSSKEIKCSWNPPECNYCIVCAPCKTLIAQTADKDFQDVLLKRREVVVAIYKNNLKICPTCFGNTEIVSRVLLPSIGMQIPKPVMSR